MSIWGLALPGGGVIASGLLLGRGQLFVNCMEASGDHESLSVTLDRLLRDHVAEDGVTFGALLKAVTDRGFGLVLMLLALPSALPVPAPGYSTPFGIAIALLGLQMVAGRHVPWVPQWVQDLKLSAGFGQKLIGAGRAFIERVEVLVRPRLSWVANQQGRRFLGVVVMTMGGLMIIPLPGTNTFPAMVIFVLGLAVTEEDGFAGFLAAAAGVGAVLLYGVAIYLLLTTGFDLIGALKDWMKGLWA